MSWDQTVQENYLIKSLKRKLKGVRQARKRDIAKLEKKLKYVTDDYQRIVNDLLDKNLDSQYRYQLFLYFEIKDKLIDSGKLTRDEWTQTVWDASRKYRAIHEKENFTEMDW
jgi:hypothetical protein